MDNAYRNRLRESQLSEQKTLDQYDFSYQPELDKRGLMELASCRFIDQRKNVILMGKPGVGKTHLANALGYEAIKRGKKVWMVHASELTARLYSSKADGTYKQFLAKLVKLDLLIIDELGFKKIPQGSHEDFFEVIRLRYEQGSMMVTTNRNFEDWASLFGDAVLASAIIDRLVHHASIIRITGPSYRVKDLVETIELPDPNRLTQKVGRPRNASRAKNYPSNEVDPLMQSTKEGGKKKPAVNASHSQQEDHNNE